LGVQLPNNKKVIPSVQLGIWRFYDWVDGNGSNPIKEWLAGESDEVQMTFNSVLKQARKCRNYRDWLCFRHKMNGKPGAEGILELGFSANGRQYRLLSKFDGELQVILLCGGFHKGNTWKPPDALETAVKRAKTLSQGKASRRERTIRNDL
jgi:hypothetical protein